MHTTDIGEATKDTSLATRLYQAGRVSIGKAANLSGLSVGEFLDHLGGLGSRSRARTRRQQANRTTSPRG